MRTFSDYLSPEELIRKYEETEILGWTAGKIGIFYSAGLLHGKHSSKERKNLILESSFINLIHYTNGITAGKFIKLDE
jgi:hypothetical protein